MAPQLQPLTPLTATSLAHVEAPKVARTLSVSSNISSGSAHSRMADDTLDRLAAQLPNATLRLWCAGNVRLGCGMDLTIPAGEAAELIEAMKRDVRFEVIEVKHFNDEGDDWVISFRRTDSPNTSPIHSDSE